MVGILSAILRREQCDFPEWGQDTHLAQGLMFP
jgi:hypothetical protein